MLTEVSGEKGRKEIPRNHIYICLDTIYLSRYIWPVLRRFLYYKLQHSFTLTDKYNKQNLLTMKIVQHSIVHIASLFIQEYTIYILQSVQCHQCSYWPAKVESHEIEEGEVEGAVHLAPAGLQLLRALHLQLQQREVRKLSILPW